MMVVAVTNNSIALRHIHMLECFECRKLINDLMFSLARNSDLRQR